MPKSDDIYMHDTPDRHLFRRPDRAFSSGCIRLEKPMELLDIVMAGTTGWSRERVDRVLASRQTAGASLARTFPVRLHYTSVIVQGDEVRMRSDIYGLDEAYVRALDQGAAAGRARMAAHGGGGR
jgi:murein L,D-transpeptidase YcbB/YkuD